MGFLNIDILRIGPSAFLQCWARRISTPADYIEFANTESRKKCRITENSFALLVRHF